MPNLEEFLENPESITSSLSTKDKLLEAAELLKKAGGGQNCWDCADYCSCATINGLLQHAEKVKS
jgi:hypothetical protein